MKETNEQSNIENAIYSDWCIIAEDVDDLKKLSPFFRGGELKDHEYKREYPVYCYAPYSVSRGRLGLGFIGSPEWKWKELNTVTVKDLF